MITKIHAAEKQLETAIKLFFENIDHISSYALASASREITDDLIEKRKVQIYLSELERIGDPQKVFLSFKDQMEIRVRPGCLRGAMKTIKNIQNFLKHADIDPDGQIDDITKEILSLFILYAISNFRLLESRLTAPMQFFLNWFVSRNPQFLLNKESPGVPILIDKIRLNFPDLDSEAAFFAAYKALELYVPSLFPSSPS